ncbi:MAG: cytochrome ubiquinol oxidase subunit I [Pseudomonadota bacterium]
MEPDPLILSRIQFAFLVTFHIIFPAFTIGLAAWLATLEATFQFTGREIYRRLFDFWLRIFALSFGMGVVSGIVMAFQFGTNWSVLSEQTGSIQGPLLGYEAFTAFLLEATFFGVMMFARNRVPSWFFLLSCCMVALGTTFSSFWIMANNSWMQVPVGYDVIDGEIVPVDWKAIIWGPVFKVRWLHMLLAAYLTTATCVAAAGAWYLLRQVHVAEARLMLRWGLSLAAVVILPQLWLGHLNGEYIAEHQPSKFTAVEGRWETEAPARLILFAWPDAAAETNHLEIAIPKVGSFIDDGSWTSEQPGIKTIPADERPPLLIPFFGFRIMVGLGVLIWAISWVGLALIAMGRVDRSRLFLWATFLNFPSGFIAIIAGWFTAEVGRQPWVVFGVLKTADAHTPTVSGGQVLASLIGFVLVYIVVYGFGFTYLYRVFRAGPQNGPQVTAPPKRPLSAAGRIDDPSRPMAE